MKHIIFCITSVVILTSLLGCQRPEPVTNPMHINADPEKTWLACKQELFSRGFEINFQNRDAGLIETSPLPGKQWFEFWKNDIVDARSLIKSSTQTTSRIVTINIQNKQDNQFIQCSVLVSKLYTSSLADSRQARKEDDFYATQNFLEKNSEEQKVWSPAGNDPKLEQAILQSIKKRLR